MIKFQGEVDAQTIEEYLDLEKKIAQAETLRYTLISIHLLIVLSIYQKLIGVNKI